MGSSGASLREAWDDDDPRAYLGCPSPGFPNFFMLGGPNSFPGSGSFMFFMEVQMRYIRGLMTQMFARGHHALEPTRGGNEAYNELVDEHARPHGMDAPGDDDLLPQLPRAGRVFVMPFLNVEYWNMTRSGRTWRTTPARLKGDRGCCEVISTRAGNHQSAAPTTPAGTT